MVSSVTSTPAATNASQTTAASNTTLAGDFNTFLKLLSTQLQNQDPLDPMDTNQFTQQLVMYSQVEQQLGTNTRLDKLVTSQNQTQYNILTSTSIGYIGKDVSFNGQDLYFDGNKKIGFTYEFEGNAQTSEIKILDESGQIVRTIDGNKTGGIHKVLWDGSDDFGQTLAAGKYTVKANIFDDQKKAIATNTTVDATVEGVQTESDGGISLVLNGNRVVDLLSVRSVRTSGTELANTTDNNS